MKGLSLYNKLEAKLFFQSPSSHQRNLKLCDSMYKLAKELGHFDRKASLKRLEEKVMFIRKLHKVKFLPNL